MKQQNERLAAWILFFNRVSRKEVRKYSKEIYIKYLNSGILIFQYII